MRRYSRAENNVIWHSRAEEDVIWHSRAGVGCHTTQYSRKECHMTQLWAYYDVRYHDDVTGHYDVTMTSRTTRTSPRAGRGQVGSSSSRVEVWSRSRSGQDTSGPDQGRVRSPSLTIGPVRLWPFDQSDFDHLTGQSLTVCPVRLWLFDRSDFDHLTGQTFTFDWSDSDHLTGQTLTVWLVRLGLNHDPEQDTSEWLYKLSVPETRGWLLKTRLGDRTCAEPVILSANIEIDCVGDRVYIIDY